MKRTLTLIIILTMSHFLFGQQKFAIVSFQLDGEPTKKDSSVTIHILQKDSLISCYFNEQVSIVSGQQINVDFLSAKFLIPPLHSVMIFNDTVITVKQTNAKILKEIVVNSKKLMVKQTLNGFEYNPQADSFFYKKSILLALQRLPFVKVETDKIEYKKDEPILFTINGKERAGITNWSDVLRNINAKDVYKVELITDIPSVIQTRGFTIIINILTADMNIYGQALSLAAIFDQRKNINSSTDITILRRKTDYSIRLNDGEDNQIIRYETKAYKNDILITENILHSKFTNKNNAVSIKYGLRIDSSKDLSASIAGNFYNNTNKYYNTYNFPVVFADQTNEFIGKSININTSYLYRKSRVINSYIAITANIESRVFSNRITFIKKQNYDSLHNFTTTNPVSIALDYNYSNNKQKSKKIELGVSSYFRQTEQDYYKYDLSPSNENNLLLYKQKDTLGLKQVSFAPYLRFTKTFTKKNNFVVRLKNELYFVKNIYSLNSKFILPSLSIIQKNILKNNNSITFKAGINYYKPGLDFLSPIQVSINPSMQSTGNFSLKPSKNIYVGGDLLLSKNSYITHSITLSHSFDVAWFFITFDSVSKQFFQKPDNENLYNRIAYSLDFDKELFDKLSIYTFIEINYTRFKNSLYQSKNDGLGFNMTNSLLYQFSQNGGKIGFRTYINGRDYSSQGSRLGSINYSLYYAKQFLKKRIVLTLLANEFIKPSRIIDANSISESYKQYTRQRQPYRLMSIRVAYNFSNIKLNKTAIAKSALISGETSNK